MVRGLKIKTFVGAGSYPHEIYDLGLPRADRTFAVSNELVEAQKRVNERLWEEMPNGSGEIVSTVTYVPPREMGTTRRLMRYITRR